MSEPEKIRFADGVGAQDVHLFHEEQSGPDLDQMFDLPQTQDGVAKAARVYLTLRQSRTEAEDLLKAHTAGLAGAESELLRQMALAGVKSLKVDGGDGKTVSVAASTSEYYSLPAGALDDTEIFTWLLRAGGHDMVKRTIHHASFNGFCRELAADGRSIHPSVKKVEMKKIRVAGG